MFRALAALKQRGIRDFVAAAAAFLPDSWPWRSLKGLVRAVEKLWGSFLVELSPPPTAKAAWLTLF